MSDLFMILTIDIGNSFTKFGIFDGKKLTKKITIETIPNETSDSIYYRTRQKISHKINAVIISTVVDGLKDAYRLFSKNRFNQTPFFANHTFDYGFSINYSPIEDCGSDRLVDAFAAVEKYGTPVIVCDFGTATTIDIVNRKNWYLGGVITPGINTLNFALSKKTSKLPKVELEKPKNIIGTSTVSSIQSGIYFGYVDLVDGIIKRIFNQLNEKPKVVSTGGFAKIIADSSEFVKSVEENLTLEGLRLISEKRDNKT